MIERVAEFVAYLESVRRRTVTFCRAIPHDRADWAPRSGELSFGELIRHLAAAEQMFIGVAVTGRWSYPGHERELAPDIEQALAHLEASHASAMAALHTLDDAALAQSRPAIDGRPVKVWRLLMLLVEHEIHHRSQIASYLSELGVEPPQIYGLHLEQVVVLAPR